MASAASLLPSCPACSETMTSPIFLCAEGHSICGTCITQIAKSCPLCRSRMTNKHNFSLEDLISKLESVSLKGYSEKECELSSNGNQSHQLERKCCIYKREGQNFGVLKDDRAGKYADILKHIGPEINLELESTHFDSNFSEIAIIDYEQQIFWYKHKIDVQNQKAYWLFQYVGTEKEAANYCYELEIVNGDARKLKINERCKSDAEDANAIFAAENCLALPLRTVKNFLNHQGKLSLRFKIIKVHGSEFGLHPLVRPRTSNSKSLISLKRERRGPSGLFFDPSFDSTEPELGDLTDLFFDPSFDLTEPELGDLTDFF